MSEEPLNLTAPDKILIHLRDNWHHRNDKVFPVTVTQKGISEATGLRLTHVPRNLKKLVERGLVDDRKAHVEGEKRRYKIYSLTEKGMAEANAFLNAIKGTACGDVKLSEELDRAKGAVLPILLALSGEGVAVPVPECKLVGPVPGTEGFVNRREELDRLGEMLDSDVHRIMIIYGSQGYGKSALAARFLEQHRNRWSAVWIPMHKSFQRFKKELEKGLGQLIEEPEIELEYPERLAAQLNGKRIILVLDHYFEASDDLVEYLAGFVAAVKTTEDFNLLVTAMESTPSYNRFYTIMDIHDGTVGEVHIRGLDMEHTREMLGTPDIDPDALRRLLMFTMGKPATLKLLAARDVEALKTNTRFKPEEIKLMLYLMDQIAD